MVQIITDSSTLITEAESKELGVDVIPLSISILDEEYRDLQVDMDHFYGLIAQGGVPRSSQPPIGEFVEAFKRHAGQKIINIAMADGLSGTYLSACGAREMVDNKESAVPCTPDGGAVRTVYACYTQQYLLCCLPFLWLRRLSLIHISEPTRPY